MKRYTQQWVIQFAPPRYLEIKLYGNILKVISYLAGKAFIDEMAFDWIGRAGGYGNLGISGSENKWCGGNLRNIRGLTIKFASLSLCTYIGSPVQAAR